MTFWSQTDSITVSIMLNSRYPLILVLACLLPNGCDNGGPSRLASTTPESAAGTTVTPQYDGVILHTFPDKRIAGVDTPPASANEFEGLAGEHTITRKQSESERLELRYQFELLDHREGKDIYRIRREVRGYKPEEDGATSSSGRSVAFDIEYDGSSIAIADDKYGVTKVMSRERGIKDGQYVNGSAQTGINL